MAYINRLRDAKPDIATAFHISRTLHIRLLYRSINPLISPHQSTLAGAVSDVYQLHAKVARKAAVESFNHSRAHALDADIAERLR